MHEWVRVTKKAADLGFHVFIILVEEITHITYSTVVINKTKPQFRAYTLER